MKLSVRSRSQAVSHGRGYVWAPQEPKVARLVEADRDLVSDYSRTLLIWQEEKTYHIYLRGLDAGWKDDLDRPIKHTLVWEDSWRCLPFWQRRSWDDADRAIRAIALQYVRDPDGFEDKVRELIESDADLGFLHMEDELLELGDDVKLNSDKAPATLTQAETSGEAVKYLASYALRKSCRRSLGLLVAVGDRFPRTFRSQQGRYPSLQLVWDSERTLEAE